MYFPKLMANSKFKFLNNNTYSILQKMARNLSSQIRLVCMNNEAVVSTERSIS